MWDLHFLARESHPVGHVVGLAGPVVVVEDEDGRHHAGRHHEHDGIEVSGWNTKYNVLHDAGGGMSEMKILHGTVGWDRAAGGHMYHPQKYITEENVFTAFFR